MPVTTNLASAWCRFAGFILAVQILCFVLAIALGGFVLGAPADAPQQADLIAILGGGTGDRLVKGKQLFHQGFARHVLMTGMTEENMLVRPLHAYWRTVYLEQLGVPGSAIVRDSSATNTWQEARLIRKLMLENGWTKVLVVSDPPHLLRLSWVFERCFKETALSYRLVSSDPMWWDAARWWGTSTSTAFVIEEFIKIVYYAVKYE